MSRPASRMLSNSERRAIGSRVWLSSASRKTYRCFGEVLSDVASFKASAMMLSAKLLMVLTLLCLVLMSVNWETLDGHD